MKYINFRSDFTDLILVGFYVLFWFCFCLCIFSLCIKQEKNHTSDFLLARCQHLKFEVVGFNDDLCRVD